MKLSDRTELADFFQARMNKTYYELKEEQHLSLRSSLIKTYMIEAHTTENIVSFFENACEKISTKTFSLKEISESKSSELINITLQYKREDIFVYLVNTDNRFWLLHSFAESKLLDYILERLIGVESRIDRFWLPIQLLELLTTRGKFNGLGLSFDRRRYIHYDSPMDNNDDTTFLKLQLWGNKAQRIYNILKQNENFPNETTLSKVRIKHELKHSLSNFSLNDVKFNGKVTARGTSFESHVNFIYTLVNNYSKLIKGLEDEYAISMECENDKQLNVSGAPIIIELKRPITNFENFVKYVFNCSNPFRLMGQIINKWEHRISLSVLDLHVGGCFDCEITNNEIYLYLEKGTCGNTVIRLLTNIQHYYDSLANLAEVDFDRRF